MNGSVEDVLAALVEDENGCLIWPFGKQWGYGSVSFGKGDGQRVHRLAWQFVNGAIPDGHDLHHVCKNRACGNVEHLEPVLPRDHQAKHRSGFCKRGHRIEGANLVAMGGGKFRCRECQRKALAAWYQRGKERFGPGWARRRWPTPKQGGGQSPHED